MSRESMEIIFMVYKMLRRQFNREISAFEVTEEYFKDYKVYEYCKELLENDPEYCNLI